MSNRIIAFIKDHPYGTAAGIVGAYLAYEFLFSSSGTSTSSLSGSSSSGLSADEINAGNQLALAQLQAQAQSSQTGAAASVANNQTAAQLSAVQIAANSSDNQAGLSAQTAQITANLEAQTQQVVSTLSAQVADTTTAAQVAVDANNNQTEYNIAALPYDLAAMQLNSTSATQLNALQEEIQNVADTANGVFANVYAGGITGAQNPGNDPSLQVTTGATPFNINGNNAPTPVTGATGATITI